MSNAPTDIFILAECGCRFRVVSGLPVLAVGVLDLVSKCNEHRGEPRR